MLPSRDAHTLSNTRPLIYFGIWFYPIVPIIYCSSPPISTVHSPLVTSSTPRQSTWNRRTGLNMSQLFVRNSTFCTGEIVGGSIWKQNNPADLSARVHVSAVGPVDLHVTALALGSLSLWSLYRAYAPSSDVKSQFCHWRLQTRSTCSPSLLTGN